MAAKAKRADGPYEAVLSFVSRWDPIGLEPGKITPRDEYRSEANEIAARLDEIRNATDAGRLLSDAFLKFFGVELAGHLAYHEAGKRFYKDMVAAGVLAPVVTVLPGGKQGRGRTAQSKTGKAKTK